MHGGCPFCAQELAAAHWPNKPLHCYKTTNVNMKFPAWPPSFISFSICACVEVGHDFYSFDEVLRKGSQSKFHLAASPFRGVRS